MKTHQPQMFQPIIVMQVLHIFYQFSCSSLNPPRSTYALTISLVRSHLEYANSVWNPHRLGLIRDLEKVQMRATKLVISINLLRTSLIKTQKLK